MVSFLVQTAQVLKVSRNNQNDVLGKPVFRDEIVTTLKCRVDPVRFRSREYVQQHVRELEFHQMVYTECTDKVLTQDMRLLIDGIYFNIVSVDIVTSGVNCHHLEIEVYKGFNV